jgi:hypothetical protein
MRANTLNVHLKKHMAADPFRCPVDGCSAHYTEKGNLTKHIRQRHPGVKISTRVGSESVGVYSAVNNPEPTPYKRDNAIDYLEPAMHLEASWNKLYTKYCLCDFEASNYGV